MPCPLQLLHMAVDYRSGVDVAERELFATHSDYDFEFDFVAFLAETAEAEGFYDDGSVVCGLE